MRLRYYLITAPLLLFTACSNHEALTGPTHENGLVELSAGIVESGSQMATRAGAEDNHANHKIFTPNTQLALWISGKWNDHDDIIETTTATIGATTEMTKTEFVTTLNNGIATWLTNHTGYENYRYKSNPANYPTIEKGVITP